MILGLGMDLIEVPRIAEMIKTDRFLQRVYTPAERSAIAEKGAQTAAGYFAAKEAVAKALGTGFTGFGPAAISVEYDELGAPRVLLSGGAQARFQAIGGRRILLTLTHLASVAAATAIVEGEDRAVPGPTGCRAFYRRIRKP